MKKRYFAKRPKGLPKGYDSKLEYRLHQTCLKGTQHHVPTEDRVPYKVEHTYEPDYVFTHYNKLYITEAKGRAREQSELRKLCYVRDHFDEWQYYKDSGCTDIELVLIFENSSTPMPFAKKRKDGTKQSHGEWATRNGFRWLCEKRGDLEDVVTRSDLIKKLDELN
jgi:hypothetical protein